MAFLRRPRPFSLSVLSPADIVSGRLTPASSRAASGRAARNRPERANAARERHERRFIKNLLRGMDSTGTWIFLEGERIGPERRPIRGEPMRKPKSRSRKSSSPSAPTLTVSFVSIEVKHNGWPGEGVKATDLSLILQLEDPAASGENAALASARLPFAASSGQTATAIVPVDASFEGTHPVTLALVAPRTIPGLYAPPGSPEGYKKGVVSTEGDLTALLHLTLALALPG